MYQECTKCGIVKPLTREHFYFRRDRMTWNGVCIECKLAYLKQWRAKNPDTVRSGLKHWATTHPEQVAAGNQRWKDTNPERHALSNRAKAAVNRAIRKGILIRPTACEKCGASCKPDGAHQDYSRPLEVKWLCRGCHNRWDRLEPKTRVDSTSSRTSVFW